MVQEAIAAGCPTIVNQVIPGQEEGNRVITSKRLLEAARSKGKGGDASPTVTTVVSPN